MDAERVATVLDQARQWQQIDPDEATVSALGSLIDQAEQGDEGAIAELLSAFAGPLTFGTAGLRAALGPGPARMNRVVVSRAAAGFAAWLTAQGRQGPVVIGHDARYNSLAFATDTAEIMQAAGFEAILVEQNIPTPVVAFGIHHYGAVAGVVVTASHNPANDNGYKVYLGDGSQIVPPADAEIADQIAAVGPLDQIPRSNDYRLAGDDLVEAYVASLVELVDQRGGANAEQRSAVTWVHTAMHGVGTPVVARAAAAAGFANAIPVVEQMDPDPTFPTVAFPNPEEPGAIDLALELAAEHHVDVVIANDPDADRCAVAAQFEHGWRMLSGDELGALIGHHYLSTGVQGTYANSLVSSTLLAHMAEHFGQPHEQTLTGFKWIARAGTPEAPMAFGYEEAIGYCPDPAHVQDKDGIATAMVVLAIVAGLKASGRTIADRLDEIAATFGVHATAPLTVRVQDLSLIATAMQTIRANPPSQLLGEPVEVLDLSQGAGELPPTDAVELTGHRVHVVVRPSGTEPKLKCYMEVRDTPERAAADLAESRAATAAELASLRTEMAAALGVVA